MKIETKVICQLIHRLPRNEGTINLAITFLEDHFKAKFSVEGKQVLSKKIETLLKNLNKALNIPETKRNLSRALKHMTDGEGFFEVDDSFLENEDLKQCSSVTSYASTSSASTSGQVGRPRITDFNQMSKESKRKFVNEKSVDLQSLDAALKVTTKLAKAQNPELVSEIKQIAKKAKGEISTDKQTLESIDLEDALSLIINSGLTVAQYEEIRNQVNSKTKNLVKSFYPTYKKVANFKNIILPNNIEATDTSASVPVRDLSKNTLTRLIQAQKDKIIQILKDNKIDDVEEIPSVILYGYGFDGTRSKEYHMADEEGNAVWDKSLFVSSMAPIKLYIPMANGQEIVLWMNPSPGSNIHNRPISVEFTKENKTTIVQKFQSLKEEIDSLEEEVVEISDLGVNLIVTPEFKFVYADGKVTNAITNTPSTQSCDLCQATPSMMNIKENLSNGVFKIKTNNHADSIPILHTIINSCLNLYRISVRLNIKTWKVIKQEDKQKLAENEARVKARIYDTFKIHFQEVRKDGGTSTTGGICRKLLESPERFAQVLNLNADLVKRISNIFKLVSCRKNFDIDRYQKYCEETFDLYVSEYGWYFMSQTLHKLLIHSHELFRNLPVAPGYLTEEGAEAQNKFYRNFREHHARTTSRKDNIKDVFVRTLLVSDPVLVMKRKETKKKSTPLPEELECFIINENEDEDQNLNDSDNEELDENVNTFEEMYNFLDNYCISELDLDLENDEN
jgi:hypothetical protein